MIIQQIYTADAIDPAARWIRPHNIIDGARVNKAYNSCLFTRLPGK